MKKGILLLILVFGTHCAFTQSWEHYFPPSSSKYATGICQTYDGGYLMSVVLATSNTTTSYIYKLDEDGNILWVKNLFVGGQFSVRIDDICPTFDNGFIICGISGKYDYPSGAAFIMKLNECGEREWTKEYGTLNNFDYIHKVIQLTDSNYLALGMYLDNDIIDKERIVLIKFNNNGDTIWKGNYTHFNSSTGLNIREIDSNIYISGDAYLPKQGSSLVYLRSLLVKVDFFGNEVWYNAYDSVKYHHFVYGVNTIKINNKSNLFLTDYIDWHYTTKRWNYLIKTDSNGNVIWKKFVSPQNDLGEYGSDIIKINDSTAIIVCSVSYYYNFNSADSFNLKFIKIDLNGNVLDSARIGTGINFAWKSILNKDGDVVICGYHDYGSPWGPFVIKIKQNLQVDTMLNMTLNYDSLCATTITTGTIVYDTTATSVGINELETKDKIKMYPNPVSDFLSVDVNSKAEKTLTLFLYNLLGVEQKQFSFHQSTQLNVKDFATGIYIYKIMEGSRMFGVGKIIKD